MTPLKREAAVAKIRSRFVSAAGFRTHYLEAGEGPPLVLLHSGEYGACAELSWERNLATLAASFHVLAPDWLGYGRSDKFFDFENMRERRIQHMAAFLSEVVGDRPAFFAGNSMGGTMLLEVAARDEPPWRLGRIVSIAGGGAIPDSPARAILNNYDGSREQMANIVRTLFVDPTICDDEDYIDRRHRLSLDPGAWECVAAARFKAPWRTGGEARSLVDYSRIATPTLIVAGGKDRLRDSGFGPQLQRQIPGAQLIVIEGAGHCPQIEAPDEVNAAILRFLAAA